MKCLNCNFNNKCERCKQTIKEIGRIDFKKKEAWCIKCYKILLEKEKPNFEEKPIQIIRKTGGGGDDKRKDADKFFDKTMEKMEHLGSGDKRLQDVNSNGRNDEIRHLQKEANKAIEVKQKDNRDRGRHYNDGKNF